MGIAYRGSRVRLPLTSAKRLSLGSWFQWFLQTVAARIAERV